MNPTRRKGGRRWRELRAFVLSRDPLCVLCKAENRITAATEADHIVPLHQGGGEFDINNIRGLCHDHHARVTADALGKRRIQAIGVDGWPIGA